MPTRRARLRRRIYRKLPNWLKKHDFEVFASVLGMFSGLPVLLGKVDPQSVEALLPGPVVFAWGLTLVFGCLCVLIGVFQGSRRTYPKRIFWMRVEALGLTALAYYCYIYAVCILGFNFTNGYPAAMLILTFGGVCHVREATIHMEIEEYRASLGLRERV
jgi:hypothetical protein